MTKKMVTVFCKCQMVIVMKENGSKAKNKAKENTIMRIMMFMKVNFLMVLDMARENIYGTMVHLIREIGIM